MTKKNNLDDMANAIRFLSIDAVQAANSGHPGLPMGAPFTLALLPFFSGGVGVAMSGEALVVSEVTLPLKLL